MSAALSQKLRELVLQSPCKATISRDPWLVLCRTGSCHSKECEWGAMSGGESSVLFLTCSLMAEACPESVCDQCVSVWLFFYTSLSVTHPVCSSVWSLGHL